MQSSRRSDSELSALMERAINGDRSAYAQCLSSFAAISRALCATRLEDEREIERIVQISLVRAHRKSCTFNRRGSFTGWVWAITRRELDVVAPPLERKRSGGLIARFLPGGWGPDDGPLLSDEVAFLRPPPTDRMSAGQGDGP